MSSKICIVGKGSSLLNSKLGDRIDEHDIVIRVNNIPTNSNSEFIGNKTTIFSSRAQIKLKEFWADIINIETWICSELIGEYTEFNTTRFIYINSIELDHIKTNFTNFSSVKLDPSSQTRGFYLPDTGINTIILTILRFPDCTINVCGFDLYKNGNISIYGSSSNRSIFLTPVLQQLLLYKKLISSGKIVELK